jgi:Icc-related predicted phosphoesterase
MSLCFFAADLHGHEARYASLLRAILEERPAAVFLGGDLLPRAGGGAGDSGFLRGWLAPRLRELRRVLAAPPPRIFLVFGNDDPRSEEPAALELEREGLLEYAHLRRLALGRYDVYGYACVPPTPFLLKDWERYDVSRYCDPGALSPEEGWLSVPRSAHESKWTTIASDLETLTAGRDLERAVLLFHSPPYRTALDRAALDGHRIEHVPLDPHVGSIAIRRFIEERQPWLTLHGHIHESARLTGAWRERLGRTLSLSAAHDGPELALVRFTLETPDAASRELI